MGFRNDIVKLLKMMPDPSRRQTLLYSATMPTDLQSIVKLALRPDYEYINCVGADASETASNAKQSVAVVPKTDWLPRLAQVRGLYSFVPGMQFERSSALIITAICMRGTLFAVLAGVHSHA